MEMDDTKSRHRFIRKVLITVQIQLIIATAIALPFMFNETVQNFALDPKFWWVKWVCFGTSLLILFMMGCYEYAARSFPINVFLLLIFTTVEGLAIGFLVAASYPQNVLIALCSTIGVVFTLVLFACQVKYDFTGWLIYVFAATVIFLLVGILISIFYRKRLIFLVLAFVGLLIFSIYLIINIQMLIGGRRKYVYSEEDWIPAAISIFIDIKAIFVYILTIVGILSD